MRTKRFIISAALFIALVLCVVASAWTKEPPQKQKPETIQVETTKKESPHSQAPKSGNVGSAKCVECHQKQGETIQNTYHGVAEDPRTPAAKMGCETCHGPGFKHASEQDPEGTVSVKTFGPRGNQSREQQNAVCLGCHQYGNQAHWASSSHELRQVGCQDCHKIHGGHEKNLAKENQVDLCVSCHKNMKADMHRLSRHPLDEGKIKCADCHNPHGSVGEKMLVGNTVNETCYKCHAEKRGPFLWPHAPVTENCLNCHKPHASTNEKLLTVRKPLLCQQCHSGSQHPTTLYAQRQDQFGAPVYDTLTNKVSGQSCNNCHVNTHGSNHPSGKFFQR